jgi:hypothetical protein
MKLKVQFVVYTDDGHVEQVQKIAVLKKDYQRVEHVGLTLAEAKQLLTRCSTTSSLSRPLRL